MFRGPRTCWRPLAATLVMTFALSIGLTFRNNDYCYAGTCGAHLFPLQTRLHVIVWYSWLGLSITFLTIRARQPVFRRGLQRRLSKSTIPLLGMQWALGGVLVLLWVLSLYGVVIGLWWTRLNDYFDRRGIEGGVFAGNRRLAAVALTGHLCDITMGMAILPVSRHSALASLLNLSVATTLTFHMLTAYTLFALVVMHGLFYVSWIPLYNSLAQGYRIVYPVLNPTYLYDETWPGARSGLGVWRASLIFSGLIPAIIMLLIFSTTWPAIRKNHFNVFYFTHLMGVVAIVIVCLHASTMFYCTSPGLLMWLLDWSMRLYELRQSLDSNIQALGKEWYLLSVPLPRNRLFGCARNSPLSHFFLHHSESSLRELHPFCSTTALAAEEAATSPEEDTITIKFLFRKRGVSPAVVVPPIVKPDLAESVFARLWRKKNRRSRPQWTDSLAGFANEGMTPQHPIDTTTTNMAGPRIDARGEAVKLRLEGPYYTTANPSAYDTVVCVVAGTGISGAMAITGAFRAQDQQGPRCEHGETCGPRPEPLAQVHAPAATDLKDTLGADHVECVQQRTTWRRCIVVWSVREEHYIDLPELTGAPTPGFELRLHLTGPGRKRISIGAVLDDILGGDKMEDEATARRRAWVYVSGPNAFIEAGEAACRARYSKDVDCHGARWDI